MSKQKSAIAGAVGLVLTVIATAIGLNVGILGATSGEGDAAPASTVPDTTWATSSTTAPSTTTTVPGEPRIVTVYVDEVVPAGADSVASAAPAPASAAPSAASAPAPVNRSASTPAPAAPAPRASAPKPAAARAPTTAAPKAPAAPAPTAATPAPAAPAASYPKYDVPGIGTVTLQHADGQIHFWAASTNSGWHYRVEKDGAREVEVKFRAGGDDEEDEGEAKFKAQLENGQIKVRTEIDD